MKTIVICSNIPVFWNNKILDKEHCSKYFGASWMPIFAELVKQFNFEVISGDIALDRVKNNDLNLKDIYVIQELNAKHGIKLINLGAKGLVLTGAESPLFSYYFYDNFKKYIDKFIYKKLFNGSYKLINYNFDNIKNTQFYFPSYSLNEEFKNQEWNNRKFMVMIAANKNGYSPCPSGMKNKFIWSVHYIYKLFSISFKIAQANELHSKRLEIIKYFAHKNRLDLFGSNWKEYFRFKISERNELKEIIEKLNPSFVDDKIETLSKYKFTVCFENIAFDGYITEKIIHCFISGTIPIYLGANDINKFIPKSCFIDFRDFLNFEELDSYLTNLNERDALSIIENGKSFLESEDGKKYSYEYFAQEMLNIVKSIDDNN